MISLFDALEMKPIPSKKQYTAVPLSIDPTGVAQVEAERKRLGITEEELERRRDASNKRPF